MSAPPSSSRAHPTRAVLALLAGIATLPGCPAGGRDGSDGGSAFDAASTDGARGDDVSAVSPSDDGDAARDGLSARPVNRWQLRLTDAPVVPWEVGFTYDPTVGRAVQHGGHVPGNYVQSSYTNLYDPLTDAFTESLAPSRPQRRCIVELVYTDALERVLTVHGASDHGSMPQGGPDATYTRIRRTDAAGPWLYDAAHDRWEETRPPEAPFVRSAHSQLAYDPGSDAVFTLVEDTLEIYSPHANRVITRALPPELTTRLSYGIAVDPASRTLVVFGGSGPGGWVWVHADPAVAYEQYVHGDTWLYDIAHDRWRQAHPAVSPPRGMPLFGHIKLPMQYHGASGTVVLLQNDVDHYDADPHAWGPLATWSFDVARESWTRVPTEAPPEVPGVLAYARDDDALVMLGGGLDGTVDGNPSILSSRRLYTLRLEVPDHPRRAASATPARVTATTRADGAVDLAWDAASASGAPCEIYRADASATVPGEYTRIATLPAGAPSHYTDAAPPVRGRVYVYQVGCGASAATARSVVAFNRPVRPGGLTAVVTSATQVALAWEPARAPDVVGYHVYRAHGTALDDGSAQRLTAAPVTAPRFVDAAAGLGDAVISGYHVRAVNAAGIESGPSPLAYTAPDAPTNVDVTRVGTDQLRVRFVPPAGVRGVRVYSVDHHVNTLGFTAAQLQAWYDSWRELTAAPASGGEVTVTIPADRVASPHQYVYLRAENALGQLGFFTDIVSATDPRFHSAVRW